MLNFHFSIERWKWNPKLELYVSTHGRFRNSNKKLVDIKINQNGYCSVYAGGEYHKFVSVHRAVLETWRPCPGMDRLTVDHNDHNKRNNWLNNLEWVTETENKRRATADCVRVIVEGAAEKVGTNVTSNVVSTGYSYRLELIKDLVVTVEQFARIVSLRISNDNIGSIIKVIAKAVKNGRKEVYGFPIKTRSL